MSNSLFLFSFTFPSLLALRRFLWLHSHHLNGPLMIRVTPLASNKIEVLGVCNHQLCQWVKSFLSKQLFFNIVYSLNITLHYFEKRTKRRKFVGKNKQGVWRRRTLRTFMHYTSSSTILEDHRKGDKKATERTESRRDEKCVYKVGLKKFKNLA